MKIVVVDDDRDLRRMTATALSYCVNRDVLSFGDGEHAWNYIEQGGAFDIVISDVDMPDMNGFDLMARVREKYPDKIFIIMSGMARYEETSHRKGANAFLAKPFELNDLFNIVQYFVVEQPPQA